MKLSPFRLPFLFFAVVTLPLMAALTGCHSAQPPAAPSEQSPGQQQFKTYPLRGKIVSVNAAAGEVTIDGQAIPGYMEAMTMPYKVRDTRMIGELHPGDTVTTDVLVGQGADASVYVDHFVVVDQAKPDYVPKVEYHVPAAGDQVPDFRMTNENGRPIHLDEFHGKAVLITFIYTHCPLPDFCPRVTHSFAEIHKSLAANSYLYNKAHLVTASFDPGGDTPAVLREYAKSYIGPDASNAFAHWDFAVPTKANLPSIAQFFDIGLTSEADKTITHTLSTTLIGPDGKVVQFYPGNDWTPQQVLADIEKLYSKS